MNNVICAIAKNENKYINNWCNYHIALGFDHIYLFDNNDSTMPFVGDFIEQKDKVTIFNVNNIHEAGFQNKCYTKFYTENNKTFDWCAFIDIDEFIVLKNHSNISEFLASKIFNKYEVIKLKWHIYGDDNIIERDETIPVQNFFKKHLTNNKRANFAKTIIRGGLEDIAMVSSHYPTKKGSLLSQCTSTGKETRQKMYVEVEPNEIAWLNHYQTKTLKEFLDQKLNRTDCQFKDSKLTLDYYWVLNTKTKEKEAYIKKYLERIK